MVRVASNTFLSGLLTAFLFLLVSGVQAQDLQQPVTLTVSDRPLEQVLDQLTEQTNIPFFFREDLLEGFRPVTLKVEQEPLEKVLYTLFRYSDLGYKPIDDRLVLRYGKSLKDHSGWVFPGANRPRYSVSGTLRDKISKEGLPGAVVALADHSQATAANSYGFYSLTLPEGIYDLEVSMLGFETTLLTVELTKDQKLPIDLAFRASALQEVVVEDDPDDLRAGPSSLSQLPLRHFNAVPPLLGSRDVLEGVQAQAGVMRKTEGTTGFHVRGGNLDQNLILIDEAPVYNESHMLGFLSVFNANAIKSSQFYRSGIPARYGGRLSSVLDLRMKEGNLEQYNGSAEVTPLFGQLTLEGPLAKGKSSFLVSGRGSYANLILDQDIEDSYNVQDLSFYDINAKFNVRLGENDRIYLSGYQGKDQIKVQFEEDDEGGTVNGDQNWGNRTGTLRWNHVYGKKLFSNTSLIYSNYDYRSTEFLENTEYNLILRIEDFTGKVDFNYYPSPSHHIQFGGSVSSHLFTPGDEEQTDTEESDTVFVNFIPEQRAIESGIYAEDVISLGKRWKVQAGFRLSLFQNVGETALYEFDENGSVVDVDSSNGGVYNTYMGPEPRLSVSWSWKDNQWLSLRYDRNFQYLHLASNRVTKAPTDLWLPSSPNIEPQVSDQISLEQVGNFKEGLFSIQTALFWKRIGNSIDFRDRANLLLNELIEGELVQGEATAIGWELQVEKLRGAWTGALNYTLSQTDITVASVNNGETYPAAFDRPHQLQVWSQYKLKDHWSFRANFLLASGLPFNFPVSTYLLQQEDLFFYGPKNSDRLPTYHRMDVAVTYASVPQRRFRHEVTLSVYNVYDRTNAYALDFNQDSRENRTADLFYVFRITPSFGYRFLF